MGVQVQCTTRYEISITGEHDYTIGTLDVLQACDACADMGMTYSVIVQCTDCVICSVELISCAVTNSNVVKTTGCCSSEMAKKHSMCLLGKRDHKRGSEDENRTTKHSEHSR